MFKRLKEPSTWAGVGTVLSAAVPFLPGVLAAVASVGAAAAGAIAVGLREKGAPAVVESK